MCSRLAGCRVVRARTASTAFVKEEVDVAVQIKKAKKTDRC